MPKQTVQVLLPSDIAAALKGVADDEGVSLSSVACRVLVSGVHANAHKLSGEPLRGKMEAMKPSPLTRSHMFEVTDDEAHEAIGITRITGLGSQRVAMKTDWLYAKTHRALFSRLTNPQSKPQFVNLTVEVFSKDRASIIVKLKDCSIEDVKCGELESQNTDVWQQELVLHVNSTEFVVDESEVKEPATVAVGSTP